MNRSQRRSAVREALRAGVGTDQVTDRATDLGRHRARAAAALGSAAVLASAGAGAAVVLTGTAASANPVIEVTNTDDSGAGSLRAAITAANATAGQDEIHITATGTVVLLGTLPTITGDGVSIVGPGSDHFTVDGDDRYNGLMFSAVTSGSLSVSGLTVTGANGQGVYVGLTTVPVTITDVVSTDNTAGCAGGFWLYHDTTTIDLVDSAATDNAGVCGGVGLQISSPAAGMVVNVSHSRFTNNTAALGGAGISVNHATVSITDSVISGNQGPGVTSEGGGVAAYGGSSLRLERVVVSGNGAVAHGGGVWTDGSQTTIVDSTISGNHAQFAGGGVQTLGDGVLVVTGSTISGNDSQYYAGGLYLSNYGGQTIADSTISGNRAHVGAGMIADGSGPLAILSSTITANTVDAGSGVAGAIVRGTTVTATSSIVAGNGTSDLGGRGFSPMTVQSDHTLLGVVDPTTVAVVDVGGTRTGVTAAQLALGPLADNGGPTLTHALLPGSVAIDAGGVVVPSFPGNEWDQRGVGYARVENGVLDVGAYEVQVEEPEPEPTFTG